MLDDEKKMDTRHYRTIMDEFERRAKEAKNENEATV